MIFDKEELDEERLPFNPKINETVTEFLRRQKIMGEQTDYPEGTEFECRRCGDCCRWHYFVLETRQGLIDQLYMIGPRHPHGYWVIIENPNTGISMLHCYMPTWAPREGEAKLFHFEGGIPEKHQKYCWRTGRTHGYWVLNDKNEIVIYAPVKCRHFDEPNHCTIYAHRPDVCREFMCGRYPLLKGESN